MFIYKITVIPLNQVYIGFDTKPEYKKSRWKSHCKESVTNPKKKLHISMKKYGIESCTYEVIERGFDSLAKLALAEIKYIQYYDSYHNGLNSTPGGDGIGHHDLTNLDDNEIKIIKSVLGERFKKYNNEIKWANTTSAERKEFAKKINTPEIIAKRVKTQLEYYKNVPGAREKHSSGFKEWAEKYPEKKRQIAIKNGLKGAEKVSKKVEVITENGTVETYASKSEFRRKTGILYATLLSNMRWHEFYKGYKIKGYK